MANKGLQWRWYDSIFIAILFLLALSDFWEWW